MNRKSFKILKSFLLFLLCSSITAVIFSLVVDYFDIRTGFDSKSFDTSLLAKFIFMVVVFPFLETLIFQHVPAKVVEHFEGRKYVVILISPVLFGLYHFYSWIYIIFGFCLGVIFILFYLRMKKYSFYPLIMTFVLHGAHNVLGFVYFDLL